MKSFTAADFIDADLPVLKIRAIEHTVNSGWSRPDPLPRACEGLLYFVRGSIEYYFEDRTFTANPGQVVRLPGNRLYSGRKLDDGPLEFYLVNFVDHGEFIDFPIPDAFYPSDSDAVVRAFESLCSLWKHRTICSGFEAKVALGELLLLLAKDVAVNLCRYDDRSRILQMTDYIEANLSRPGGGGGVRVGDVAAQFHISQTHLRRIFTKELGISPSEYITSSRIERAKNLLVRQPDASIGEIAAGCGYSSVYYFDEAFRTAVGCTPGAYRERMRALASY